MKNNLYSLRRSWGYTQDQAAEHFGISREQWNRIERGHCEPSLSLALRIAAEFDTTVEQVFTLE